MPSPAPESLLEKEFPPIDASPRRTARLRLPQRPPTSQRAPQKFARPSFPENHWGSPPKSFRHPVTPPTPHCQIPELAPASVACPQDRPPWRIPRDAKSLDLTGQRYSRRRRFAVRLGRRNPPAGDCLALRAAPPRRWRPSLAG